MIRWLSGARFKSASEPSVTQDPLAAFSEPHKEVYQVSRVNPLYKEEAKISPAAGGQDSPRKSVSSGYESRGNSSSDSGSCTECDPKPKREKRGKQERKKREKPNELIGNVLAANYSSIKRRPKRLSNGSPNGTTHLSPIPEGQVDVSIPPPIWPRCIGCQMPLQRVHNGTTDPQNFIHKYNEHFPASSNFRIQFLKEVGEDHNRNEYQHNWEECFRIQFEKHRKRVHRMGMGGESEQSSTTHSTLERHSRQSKHPELSQGILQDLAMFLSQVMTQKNSLSSEEILLAVSESIQRSLHAQSNTPTVKGEFILYGSQSPREDVYSTSSSSGYKDIYTASSSSSVDSVAERLKIFRRHKEDEVYHGDAEKSSEGEGVPHLHHHHQRDLSSSSMDSASSFSPQSSASGKAISTNMFLHEEIYSVPSSVRNILSCDPSTVNAKSVHSAECGSSAYEKLITAKRKVSDDCTPQHHEAAAPVITPCSTKGATILKKVEHPYYVAMGRPDFTLDVPQAERMMNKIALAKRQRCWCRITTSLLALVFFLVSVVVVSLVITRGRRTFGAI